MPDPDDAPHVTRVVGTPDGLVVLYPHVLPPSEDAEVVELASAMQRELIQVAREGSPKRGRYVRPKPESTCPSYGCNAPSLGALLLHDDGACALIGVIGSAGIDPKYLVPWVGHITVKSDEIPFEASIREQVTVHGMVPCNQVIGELEYRRRQVELLLQGVAD
jgi:hypothetical protein